MSGIGNQVPAWEVLAQRTAPLIALGPLQTSCGWCGVRLQEGRLIDGRESTGICKPCSEKYFSTDPADENDFPAHERDMLLLKQQHELDLKTLALKAPA